MPAAVIFGTSGPVLTQDEHAFFRDADPWGFIVFARNLETPDQIRRLTRDLRESVGRDAPVLIDQEGGRVARLTPPIWTGWTNAGVFVDGIVPAARAEAMRLRYAVIGAELADLGITVNCAPLCDVARPTTVPALRERMYSSSASEVATLARSVVDGLAEAGVLAVMKHAPGHGRATVDSHFGLPRVTAPRAELAEDLQPFRALRDLPLAMTAHVVFDAIDAERPATHSPDVISVIRTEIGFQGLLMTDDISMGALAGDVGARAAAAFAAGCDVVLHCNGDAEDMKAAAATVPRLNGRAAARAAAALAHAPRGEPIDRDAALARIAAVSVASAEGRYA